jgi:DHA1 family inner membrane transport protein
VTVALVSVPLTRLVAGVPRRRLMTWLLAGFVAATMVAAMATSYWVLLAARLATALSQAVFWAVVAPAAAGLVAPRAQGRAIAAVMASASLGILLGVPAATWLGQHAGWRLAFVAVAGLGLVTLVAVAGLLPAGAAASDHAATGTAPDARRFRLLVLVTALAITGLFTAQTYVVVFLTGVSGFSERAVSPLLLLQGLMDLAGVVCFGLLVGRWPRGALVAAVGLLPVALFGLYLGGPVPALAAGAVGLTGFAVAGVPLTAQNRIMQIAPGSTDVASAWNSAAFNVGIAGGALLGGLVLPHGGVRPVAVVGGMVAAVAFAVVLAEPLVVRGGSHGRGRRFGRRAS